MTGTSTADRTALHAVLTAIAETALDVEAGSLDPDTDLASIPGVDSVKLLRVLADVEDRFDVQIDDDLVFEIRTVSRMADVLHELLVEST